MATTYSTTWQEHASQSKGALGRCTAENFHLSPAFFGLYDTPSPFPNVEKFSLSGPTSFIGLLKRWFVLLRHVRRFRRDLRKLRSNSEFSKLVPYLPPVDPQSKQTFITPLFFKEQGRKLNGSFLKAAEQAQVIEGVVPPAQMNVVCEIGAGFGAMAETIIQRFHPALYCIIDLPETLEVSSLYLQSVFPEAVERYVPGEKVVTTSGRTVILLIDASMADDLLKITPTVGLFINTNSFAEMDYPVVQKYFALIESFPNTFLSNTNRSRQEGGHRYAGPGTYPYSLHWEFLMERPQQMPYFRQNVQMISRFAPLTAG